MSETKENAPIFQKERSVRCVIEQNESQQPSVNFIFQDEKRICVPLAFLKRFPKSHLSLIMENPENFINNENAYYIDSPSMCLMKAIEYMNGSYLIESCSLDDVVNIYDTLLFYFGNEYTEYQLTMEKFFVDSFMIFMKENNCKLDYDSKDTDHDCLYNTDKKRKMVIYGVFTEERNKIFLQTSFLFDFFNVVEVTMTYEFSQSIPYECIYPSNLYEIFTKLETYEINAEYYQRTETRVTPASLHYDSLYEEYKRKYYEKYYPEAFEAHVRRHPIRSGRILNKIFLSSSNDTKKDDKEEDVIHHEIIDIDIDEEINSMKEEDKPVLYVQSNLEVIHFLDYPPEIDIYMFNSPIVKQLKANPLDNCSTILLQTSIQPYINALQDGLFDNIQILDLRNLISLNLTKDEMLLFKSIFEEHVFSNITTIKINVTHLGLTDLLLTSVILSLITRNNFPKLSSYDIYDSSGYLKENKDIIYELFPISLIELVDLIQFNYNESNKYVCFNEKLMNRFMQVHQYHPFKIRSNFSVSDCSLSWKQLIDAEIMDINTIYFKLDPRCLEDPYTFLNGNFSLLCGLDFKETKIINIALFLLNYLSLCDGFEELPLWTNLREITIDFQHGNGIYPDEVINKINNLINKKKLIHLKSIFLNNELLFKNTKIDLFNVFPSIAFNFNKPIRSIEMYYEFFDTDNDFFEYCDYIYNQLQLDYAKNIQRLRLYINNDNNEYKFMDLIIKNSFPNLKQLLIEIDFSYKGLSDHYKQELKDYSTRLNPNLDIQYKKREKDWK
ncbi:hypothetical protein WA158_008512 [Blastocystis sp. Blastoise]